MTDDGQPWLTVVIATYDRWPLVAEAVASVLANAPGAEVVVRDDGSADDTVTNLRERFPGITVLEGSNVERGRARNEGASVARGRYLAFLDSDDVIAPGHGGRLQPRLEVPAPPPVVAASVQGWDPSTGRVWPLRRMWGRLPLARAALLGTVHPMQGLAVRADAFHDVGGFPDDRSLAGSEDWVLLLRLARRFPVEELDAPGALIRQHGGRSMNDCDGIIASRDRAGDAVVADSELMLTARERRLVRAGQHRFAAAHLYEAGRNQEARRRLARVAREAGPFGVRLSARLWVQTFLGPVGRVGAGLARRIVTRRQDRGPDDDRYGDRPEEPR